VPPKLPQLYLLYGNDEVRISDARLALVQQHLAPEDRDANLSEIRPPGSHPLRLEKAFSSITGELGMLGLLPDVPRVLVVYDLSDFFDGAGRKAPPPRKEPKGDIVGAFAAFVEKVLPQTPNVGIFVCVEDEEKSRQVNESGPLYELIRRHGDTRAFRERPIARDFEDAFWKGDLHATLEVLQRWRERIGSDSGARLKLYRSVYQAIDLLVQARCSQIARERELPAEVQPPAAAWPSIAKMPDFRRRQAHALAGRLSMADLQRAVAAMNRIQLQMYPTGEEPYVPDWERTMELALADLFGAAGALQ
jgi:hypothetical protein